MTTDPLFPFTRSRLKKKLLGYFFRRPEARLYLREIAATLSVDPANLWRELKVLEKEGLFHSEKQGLQKYFFLNPNHPLYSVLKSAINKAAPVVQSWSAINRSGSTKAAGGKKKVYIVAGPNGAGKTMFARKFLPEYVRCRRFVNADLIAGGIAPFSPEDSALRAGRLLLEEIHRFAAQGTDFGFETTLAGKTHRNLFLALLQKGYRLHLFFLWIPTLALALSRIRERVKRGGHSIPELVVERRFGRGIRNLFETYRNDLTSWTIFDNGGSFPYLVATGDARQIEIADQKLFDRISEQAGRKIQ